VTRPALFRATTLTIVAIIAAQPCVAAKPARKSVAAVDWLQVSHRTADGAIVIGNPAAKVHIVEYLSLTCSHCAALSAGAMAPLRRDYIARGLASLEVRHAVRDGFDFAASLLLRCDSPARYLGSIEALYATQPQWMERAASASALPGFDTMPPDTRLAAAAKAAGFQGFFQGRGMKPAAYAACLADMKAKEQLSAMASNSWERDQIPGTPTIEINGRRQDQIHSWPDLEPAIKAALK